MKRFIGLRPRQFITKTRIAAASRLLRETDQSVADMALVCYFTRNFNRFKSYLGEGRWRDESQPPGPPWGKARPPLQAMACFAANGQGVAIFSPSATQPWKSGPHAGGNSDDPAAGLCVHVAPIDRVNLGPKSTDRYHYRYWLAVGTETQLAPRLHALWTKYSAERAELTNP